MGDSLRYDGDTNTQNAINRSQDIIRKVERLSRIDIVHPKSDLNESDKHKFNKQKEKKNREEVLDHFQQLTVLAEKAHKVLLQKNSPYRFCIYHEGEEVFIDVVLLDKMGKIGEIKHKNITHDDFLKWISHIESGEGMFFDYQG